MRRKRLIPLLTLILIISCFKPSQGLKQSDMALLVSQFLSMHVRYHSLNNEISERILNNYIDSLDYGKYYFYKKDIQSFNKYRYKIDDYIAADRYDLIFEIFELYKKRLGEQKKLIDTLLKKDFDFNLDEKVIVDREKVDFATTEKEMLERWRKNIKLQMLNYISSGKTQSEAKTKIRKKYELLVRRALEIKDRDLYAKFLNAISTALDPHSNYLTREEHEDFTIAMQLKLEGIGVRLRSEDGFVVVESIIPGGATDKLPEDVRLKPEDKIVAVAQAESEPVDVIDMDLRDVVKMIRGKKGTEVRLTVLRKEPGKTGTVRMIVPITREEIKLQDSDAESEKVMIKLDGTEIPVGYIRLPSFYYGDDNDKSSARDVARHLIELKKKKVKAIVLDLRDNPGGMLNEAVEIAGLFIDNGPILQIKDGRSPAEVKYDNDSGVLYKGPLVILVNKFSASASEILAGAIRDYKRGIVIGPGSTFGKGTVQSYQAISGDKGAIKITTHIFYQPGGTSNQLCGIVPNLTIPDLSSVWDIGEDKSRYPLEWKPIKKAYFHPYKMVSPAILQTLKSRSQGRINSDIEFKKLIENIKKMKKQLSKKTISLKEGSDIEKRRNKELEKSIKHSDKKKIIDLKNDLFLKEALNVTHDYADLLRSNPGR